MRYRKLSWNSNWAQTIRLQGHDYSAPGAYFVTICAFQQQCLFGDVVDGVMELNPFGKIVRSHWQNLPKYHPHLQLDEFIIMPNHLHGILLLSNISVGRVLMLTYRSQLIIYLLNPPHPTDQPTARFRC